MNFKVGLLLEYLAVLYRIALKGQAFRVGRATVLTTLAVRRLALGDG